MNNTIGSAMNKAIDRRALFAGTGAAGALLLLAGCASSSGPTGGAEAGMKTKTLRYTFWGSDLVGKNVTKDLTMYHEKNPSVNITGENIPWANYWTKLDTQIAGKSAPDLFQMSNQVVMDYAKRGVLTDYNQYLGHTLNMNGWDESMSQYGVGDGKRVSIPVSTDGFTVICNVDMQSKTGVSLPDKGWTWNELAAAARAAVKAGASQYGMADGSYNYPVLEDWMRGLGKSIFDVNGSPAKLGFTKDDFSNYLSWWDKLRQEGTVVPGGLTTDEIKGFTTSPIVKGAATFDFTTSSELEPFRSVMKARLQALPIPEQDGGAKKANFVRPAVFMSGWNGSPVPEETSKVINSWLNDPDVITTNGFSQGVPPSPTALEVLAKLTPARTDGMRSATEYLKLIREIGSPMDYLTPTGGRDVYSLLQRIAQDVMFGKSSIAKATDDFFSQAAGFLV